MRENIINSKVENVSISYSTPIFAKFRIFLLWLFVIGTVVGGFYLSNEHGSFIKGWVYSMTGEYIGTGSVLFFFVSIAMIVWFIFLSKIFFFADDHFQFRRTKTISLNTDEISFTQWGVTKKFDHKLPARFVLRPHDKGVKEAERHSYLVNKASKKGKALAPRKFYQKSFTLSLEHMGERHDIASIFGKLQAEKTVALLDAKLTSIKAAARTGRGVAEYAEDEWSREAGSLFRDQE